MTRSTAARSAERQSNHVAAALEAKIDNIERLLAHHEAKGNIGPWERIPGVSRRWNVTLHDGSISACGPSAKPTYSSAACAAQTRPPPPARTPAPAARGEITVPGTGPLPC